MQKLVGVPYVARHNGLMRVEDDVLNIIRQVQDISDRLDVYYDETRERLGRAPFVVVERCLDNVERKVTEAWELDQRLVSRLRAADHWHGREDPSHVKGESEDVTAVVDELNAKVQERLDEEARQQLEDAAERMHYALKRLDSGHGLVPSMPHVGRGRDKPHNG